MKKILQKFSILICFLVISCSSGDDEASSVQNNNYINLYASITEGFVGVSVVLTAFDSEGNNVTSSAEFYIDDTKINSNTHTFNSTGSYIVYATYQQLTSETKTIRILPTPIEFKKNVWVEDITGTWCRWCPRVSWAIDLLKAQDVADVIFVAVHNRDPMAISSEGSLRQFFNITSYPYAWINRQSRWGNNVNNLSQVTNEIGKKAYTSLAMESNIEGQVLSVKVKLNMGYSYESIRLGLYLLEDGLIHDQINSTDYYPEITRQGLWSDGSQDIIAFDFIHNDVLRHTLSSIFGDVISGDDVGHNKIYTREYQYTIPAYMDIENLKLVAFAAADTDERFIINSRGSYIGETQDFQPAD